MSAIGTINIIENETLIPQSGINFSKSKSPKLQDLTTKTDKVYVACENIPQYL